MTATDYIKKYKRCSTARLEATVGNTKLPSHIRGIALLIYTSRIYNSTNIARAGGTCKYRVSHTPEGTPCAIGRWIPNVLYNCEIEGWILDEVINRVLQQTKLKGMSIYELSKVQSLHDSTYGNNWDKNGLTSEGKDKLSQYAEEMCINAGELSQ